MKNATARRDGPPLQLRMAMAASILLHLSLLVVLQPAGHVDRQRAFLFCRFDGLVPLAGCGDFDLGGPR